MQRWGFNGNNDSTPMLWPGHHCQVQHGNVVVSMSCFTKKLMSALVVVTQIERVVL